MESARHQHQHRRSVTVVCKITGSIDVYVYEYLCICVGIPEMIRHGKEGFHLPTMERCVVPKHGNISLLAGLLIAPGDKAAGVESMRALFQDDSLRREMGRAARRRFQMRFELESMAVAYRQLLLRVAPPKILLDMDGTLVDWDRSGHPPHTCA